MSLQKKKGILILEQIKFDHVFKKKVIKNNLSSGKVTLPKALIGKFVYVVAKEEK